MAAVAGLLRGGWFPEAWDVPVAIGLGVVITGYLGDTIAGFIGTWVPAEWLNPVSELIIGVLLFMVGGWIGGDMSMWIRLFSFGAFAVGIADVISVALGLTAGTPARIAAAAGPRTTTAVRTLSAPGVGFG